MNFPATELRSIKETKLSFRHFLIQNQFPDEKTRIPAHPLLRPLLARQAPRREKLRACPACRREAEILIYRGSACPDSSGILRGYYRGMTKECLIAPDAEHRGILLIK